MPTLFLQTKLYRPPHRGNRCHAPQLLARLNPGLARGHKLTLVVAPAGFGKTTLVSQWLNDFGLRIMPTSRSDDFRLKAEHANPKSKIGNPKCCWLSLDESDNDLAQFLRYLIATVRTCVPEACPTMQSLLAATELPGVDYLADLLVGELSALPAALVLVLDDYHCIRSVAVHQVMRQLLRYLPPALHLVILTRTDPPLHLGRLRMEQQLTELRASDLRFAPEETRRFFEHRVAQPLDDDVLQALQARTEGWVTGLQLASISLQSQDPRQFLARFHGSDRLLVGYLVEEVMARLPDNVREFLLRTAIVDRFCAPLGDALLADSPLSTSSRATIAQLEEQNLFLIPLDDDGYWYRYHELFRDFLRHRLQSAEEPADLARLHQRACAWFARAGLIEDARRHALAAGDEVYAAELVETQLHLVLDRQVPFPILRRWLALFTEQAIHAQPGLLIAQAYIWALGLNFASLPALFVRIETLLKDDPALRADRRKSLEADVNLLHGMLACWQGESHRAILHLQAACDNLPATHLFARAQALCHLAGAHVSSGQREVGLALLHTALEEAAAHQHPTIMIFLGALAIIYLYVGELAEVALTAERMLSLADSPHTPTAWQGVGFIEVWRGWAHYLLGSVCYERNDLAATVQHWRTIEAMRHRINPRTYFESLVGRALTAQAEGALTEALAYAQAAREFAEEARNAPMLATSDALEMRLALLGGNLADPLRRSQTINTTANQGVVFWLELSSLTRVRVLLAEGAPASLSAALQIIENCLHHAENAHNIRQVIQITVLQALVLHALQRKADAFSALARALTLAEPGGFVRTFLDLGAPMAELLRRFTAQHGPSTYSTRLLAAFAPEHNPGQRRDLTAHYAKLYGITPLAPREIELLTLSSQRHSIAEIAATLVISPNTVKKHANNIYTKLGVRNRREAVAKAQELGLL